MTSEWRKVLVCFSSQKVDWKGKHKHRKAYAANNSGGKEMRQNIRFFGQRSSSGHDEAV